jgi:deoxyribodipyrimidine photo-lyase
MIMNPKRISILADYPIKLGPVVYWMQRDQRVNDNWALIYAQQQALENNSPLIVVFNLVPDFLDATIRQYDFMIRGLKEVEKTLLKYNIPFILLDGKPTESIPRFINENKTSLLVTDFNPLKIVRAWEKDIVSKISIPFHEVDAHNIVPLHQVSDKQEFAAYTIRPKIQKLLPDYLDEFPSLIKMKNKIDAPTTDWDSLYKSLKINFDVKTIDWLKPGEEAANKLLHHFINNKFIKYGTDRNFPTEDAQSNLSPYFHFGQIAPQRVALTIQPLTEYVESHESFLEEMIIRRELADNFCYFNDNYDSFDGFHKWAQDSLNLHRKDKRDYTYTLEHFENAKTHDELWNAAQLEMVNKGKMHGYMRMYWAKKILEWTRTPEEALQIAIYLNDKYELDGRDPNGYTGIAWSIGGVHDRPWFERPVYGKIRYMNYNGCAKKFDVKKYIAVNIII